MQREESTIKKKLLAVILALLAVAVLVFTFGAGSDPVLTVTIHDGTRTNTGMKYTLSNDTEDCIFEYGAAYGIERWSLFGGWSEYNGPKTHTTIAVKYYLLPGMQQEYTANWEPVYGELSPGLYRLTKLIERTDGNGNVDSEYWLHILFWI